MGAGSVPIPERIGFVGLGRMGSAMVPHLVRAGFDVTVWTRSKQKLAAFAPSGVRIASGLREVVDRSDVVLSMLFDDAAVEDVFLGSDGFLSGACDGRIFVEMSTIRPDTVAKLGAAVAEKGTTLIDGPVSGSVGPAREGKLLVLVGGPDEAVAQVTPVLSSFARRVEHVGPAGSGSAMKLVIQLPISVYWQSVGEALGIGQKLGLGLRPMLELMVDSPAALPALASKIPVIVEQSDEVSFALDAARKDLALMTRTAAGLDIPVPVTQAALSAYRRAVERGAGELDVACKASPKLN